MNNGVHWASDYPLGLALGYGLGKVAVSHGRKVVSVDDVSVKTSKPPLITDVALLPVAIEHGATINLVAKF